MGSARERSVEFSELNRRAWNEIGEVRQSMFPPAEFFADGGSTLDPRVLAAAGDVQGTSVIHLQCATGEDTISWAVAGAEATGVDISDVQIALAQRKAAEAGYACQFAASDVYALPAELQDASFDYVYTGGGALVWLPDLARWAEVIARTLKPGGQLIVFEEHPVAGMLEVEDGALRIAGSYFSRGEPYFDTGWRHFEGGEDATETKVEFAWPLGDVVTALARAGLRLESLEEFPSLQEWRFGETINEVQGLPGEYLLIARNERR